MLVWEVLVLGDVFHGGREGEKKRKYNRPGQKQKDHILNLVLATPKYNRLESIFFQEMAKGTVFSTIITRLPLDQIKISSLSVF